MIKTRNKHCYKNHQDNAAEYTNAQQALLIRAKGSGNIYCQKHFRYHHHHHHDTHHRYHQHHPSPGNDSSSDRGGDGPCYLPLTKGFRLTKSVLVRKYALCSICHKSLAENTLIPRKHVNQQYLGKQINETK